MDDVTAPADLSAAFAAIPDSAFPQPAPDPEFDAMVTEAASGPPRDELGRFTTESGEPLTVDGDAPVEAADGEQVAVEGEDGPEGEATGEGEPAPVFAVEIPLPNGNGENGLRNAGLLNLQVPDQETADTLRFHLKRSKALDAVEAEANQLREDAAFAPFFTAQPIAGFATLAERQPEAFAQFLDHATAAYPDYLAQMLEKHGYEVRPSKDPEVIAARAELAKRELRDLRTTAQSTYAQTLEQQQLIATGGRVVRSVAEGIGLSADPKDEEFVEFASRAARELDKWWDAQPAGARPTEQDMAMALQSLAQRFAALRTAPATKAATRTAATPNSTTAPKTQTPEAMKQKAEKAAQYRKLQPGTPTVSAIGKIKQKPGATLTDLFSTLRGS